MSTERTDFRITYYDRQVTRLVDRLRGLADRVEREGVPLASAGLRGTPRYLTAAERVNHAIVWELANAGAHHLFDAAFHADQAEADCADEPASSEREGQR